METLKMEDQSSDRKVTSIETRIGDRPKSNAVHRHYLLPESGGRIRSGGEVELKVEPPELVRQRVTDEGTTEGHFIRLVNIKTGNRNPADAIGLHFTSRMTQSGFSECLSISGQLDEPIYACASVFRYESDRRSRQAVHLEGPAQTPSNYRDGLVCYSDCTKRRFRSTIECRPTLKPRHYSETCYVLPKRAETVYASYADYRTDACRRKWYTTAVQVTPVTASSNFVRGFQFGDDLSAGEEDEVGRRDSEAESSGFSDDEGPSLDTMDYHPDGYRYFHIYRHEGDDFNFSSKIVVG